MSKRLYADRAVERKGLAILRILSEATEPLGARSIAAELANYGVDLSERAVRYHLRLMDERGLTRCLGEPGRVITEKGREELENALVSDKLGFVQSRIEALAYRTTFQIESGQGNVLLNASLLPRNRFAECVEIMRPVFRAGFCMSELVAAVNEGGRLGDVWVPEECVGFGTVCTVTLNGILLQHGIPVESKFGGLIEIDEGEPTRFTELISYAGTTLDPAEVFIMGRMTQVRSAAAEGRGKILGSFREVPAVVVPDLMRIFEHFKASGMGGVLAVGRPGQPLLDVPVGPDRVGIAVVGGLTPVAALAEAGIPTVNKAMKALVSIRELKSIWSDDLL
ncbi:MAG: NrpR regulatory domain-containing protein [Armatimonadota bacterium]|nr:NrpR regulatory domain-containing protein [Armatimonadota bacterium]